MPALAGMIHDHGHARGSLKTALIITATFLVAEFVGALYTNSLALLADSGHMLTDVAALESEFLCHALLDSAAPRRRKTYGFYRVEILAALLNGVFLVLIALYIFYEAYDRFLNPPTVKADWMLVVALFGLLANLASAWISVWKAQSQSECPRRILSRVDRRDRFGRRHTGQSSRSSWAAIAVADPLISVVVAILILWSSWILIRDAVDILLEGTPAHINIVSLREQLGCVDGVSSVHDLHVWTLTSGVLAMSCHVVAG